jgi:hypothetical protein
MILAARHACRRLAAAAVAVVLLGACGGPGGPGRSEPDAPSLGPASPASSPSATPTPTIGMDRYPNLGRFSDPFDRFTYKYAYGDCGIGTAERLAETYGGDPRDLPSVARAYADFSSAGREEAGFVGCLDALRANRRERGG